MTVEEFLDEIEQKGPYYVGGKVPIPDRFTLLEWMSSELNTLSSKLPDGDCFYIYLTPMIETVESTRTYDLPDEFPMNFAKLTPGDDDFCCMLNDGTNDTPLHYKSPAQFYGKNLDAESNSTPSEYTIVTQSPRGNRAIVLSPPPDSNSAADYTIGGLYHPTNWKLTEESALPPLPNNCAILKWGVLKTLNPNLESNYKEEMAYLILRLAQQRRSVMYPHMGDYGINQYDQT